MFFGNLETLWKRKRLRLMRYISLSKLERLESDVITSQTVSFSILGTGFSFSSTRSQGIQSRLDRVEADLKRRKLLGTLTLPTRLYNAVLLVVVFLTLVGCGGVQNIYTIEFTSQCGDTEQPVSGLVVADSTDEYSCHAIGDMNGLLDRGAQRIKEENRESLIFFIHGRGTHPGKLADQKLIRDLEKENNAVVIAFHWPSYKGKLGYPDESAKSSAPLLLDALQRIAEWKKNQTAECKSVMLIHSMGGIVLEEMVRSYQIELASMGMMFDTLVLNAADVPFVNHAEWLSTLHLAPVQYVTVNKNDPTLRISKYFFSKSNRLGRCLYGDEPLAANVIYVDFSQTKVAHSYYVDQLEETTGRQKGNAAVKLFYDIVLKGRALDYKNIDGIQEIKNDSPVVLHISGDGCDAKPEC